VKKEEAWEGERKKKKRKRGRARDPITFFF